MCWLLSETQQHKTAIGACLWFELWHVTFVGRNSASSVTLVYIYFVMKVWSRMFAVNVQVHSWLQWYETSISLNAQTLNSFSVVHVVNISNTNNMQWVTSRNVPLNSDTQKDKVHAAVLSDQCWLKFSEMQLLRHVVQQKSIDSGLWRNVASPDVRLAGMTDVQLCLSCCWTLPALQWAVLDSLACTVMHQTWRPTVCTNANDMRRTYKLDRLECVQKKLQPDHYSWRLCCSFRLTAAGNVESARFACISCCQAGLCVASLYLVRILCLQADLYLTSL